MRPPLLIFAWGNPARGDDALGPMLAERASQWLLQHDHASQIEVLCELQLSPEHAYDLQGRAQVIFIDAAMQQVQAACWRQVQEQAPCGWTTHACSPDALLWYCKQLLGEGAPVAQLLSLAASDMTLGQPLSPRGKVALQAGWKQLSPYLRV